MLRPAPRRLRDPAAGPDLVPLTDQPAYAALARELAALTERTRRTAERRDRARALAKRSASATTVDTLRVWAGQLAAGGLVPAHDPEEELKACATEDAILDAAIGELTTRMAALAAELSIEACRLFREQHVEALRAMHAGMMQVASAAVALHEIDVKLRVSGYEPHTMVLPAKLPRSVLLIGQPGNFGSDVATFGRWLASAFGREGT